VSSAPVILLVDDSPNDALLMAAVFQRAGFAHPLQFVTRGEEAVAYLRGEGRYADRVQFPSPAVILLDLNMPRQNGFEILAWIRRQPRLGRVRVYILSASSRQQDIDLAFDLGANAFLVKPGSFDELSHLATALLSWLKVCQYPTAPKADELPLMGSTRSVHLIDFD
jgi:CheY-like chemotaxis protein